MYFLDNKGHFVPHIHVEYQDFKAVIDIETSNLLAGSLLPSK
ncbi:MAG: DUF4160 domain-containing protein [Cytophagales bacterium]|nr:DUF4160 domain-containing protein [Cytophagales bacterium]